MTEQDQIDAVNAEKLRTDPTFQKAVLDARKSALEELAVIDASDVEAIRTAQAKVKAISSLSTALANTIIRGTPQRPNPAV